MQPPRDPLDALKLQGRSRSRQQQSVLSQQWQKVKVVRKATCMHACSLVHIHRACFCMPMCNCMCTCMDACLHSDCRGGTDIPVRPARPVRKRIRKCFSACMRMHSTYAEIQLSKSAHTLCVHSASEAHAPNFEHTIVGHRHRRSPPLWCTI